MNSYTIHIGTGLPDHCDLSAKKELHTGKEAADQPVHIHCQSLQQIWVQVLLLVASVSICNILWDAHLFPFSFSWSSFTPTSAFMQVMRFLRTLCYAVSELLKHISFILSSSSFQHSLRSCGL